MIGRRPLPGLAADARAVASELHVARAIRDAAHQRWQATSLDRERARHDAYRRWLDALDRVAVLERRLARVESADVARQVA